MSLVSFLSFFIILQVMYYYIYIHAVYFRNNGDILKEIAKRKGYEYDAQK